MLYARHPQKRNIMTGFTLLLFDPNQSDRIESVTSFVGEDASGSFGILAGHGRFMTPLIFGLARYRVGDRPWQYLAVPGALLYFADNVLSISTRHYLIDDDYEKVSVMLTEQLLAEEQDLHAMKESLHRMEDAMLKRLYEVRKV